MPEKVALVIAAIAGFLVREISGRAIDHVAARSGRVGYSARECGFFCEAETEDGRRILSRYSPDNMFVDELSHQLRMSGDLFNNTATPLLLTNPTVQFWGAEGLRVRFMNPTAHVNGERASVIAVPAHGRASLLLSMPIARKELPRYSAVLPILCVEDATGRQRQFRLSASSFFGKFAVWPRRGSIPIQLTAGIVEEAAPEVDSAQPVLPERASE